MALNLQKTVSSVTDEENLMVNLLVCPFTATNYNLFTRRRASKDYKRSFQRQVPDEVLKKRASKKRELTQIIKHSLKAI